MPNHELIDADKYSLVHRSVTVRVRCVLSFCSGILLNLLTMHSHFSRPMSLGIDRPLGYLMLGKKADKAEIIRLKRLIRIGIPDDTRGMHTICLALSTCIQGC